MIELKTDLVPKIASPMNADMPRPLRLFVAIGVLVGITACHGPSPILRSQDRSGARIEPETALADADIAAQVATVIELHNAERVRRNLPSLATNERLQRAAIRQARDMAQRKKMTHKGSDGGSPFDWIHEAGYSYQRAGENIAAGHLEPDQLMQGWMKSLPHKKNILGTYSQMGAACAIAVDGTSYWCVTFGLPVRP